MNKNLLACLLGIMLPLSLIANDRVRFTVSSHEAEAGHDILLMIRAEFSEMGQDRFISFKRRPGIRISPARIQEVSWNESHTPKGIRIQIHSVWLEADSITLTEADFTGLPDDQKFAIELTKKKE